MPKSFLLKEPEDPYSLLHNHRCLPLASDMPIVLSLWNFDFPSYRFILGKRKNLFYGESCETPEASQFLPFLGSGRLQVYAYSNRGFHFPGNSLRVPAVLSVDLFEKRVLVFLWKEDRPYKVFDRRTIRERLTEAGSYRLQAYTYRYKLWKFYFGLRSLFCSPPLQAM
ncbi:MAG: hypothetical protein RMK21_06535 [Aquificaceae bacterium]|nr:hypothetical protein [Aquificaceae bacterium]MDW8294992.1 hypothetical protein [Aquificaceae bacterium]